MELLDIVDEKGIPTGETVERSYAHANGIRHSTSHVWIARIRDEKLQILLQKRCKDKDSYPECFDISSAGHIPAGSNYLESAVRELKEELGISKKEEDLIFSGTRNIEKDDVFRGIPYHDRQFSKIYVLFDDRDEDGFTVQKEEIELVKWMDFDDLYQAVSKNTIKNCIYLEELDMIFETIKAVFPSITV